ncbi:hypothetical protein [Delftia sp. CH05]|uniref:hypothetical protein n=1 Tax=Delftia sp. CH05 TaxID=2692194 RepID=UPI00135E9F10|nr:hypothetical protein [Delftia sp. CH05]MXN30115.1 hypothetical protein [Delftia sp. CH05]
MHQYNKDTEFAASNLIALARDEAGQLLRLQSDLRQIEAEVAHHYWDFSTSDMNDDFPEYQSISAFRRMAEAHAKKQQQERRINSIQSSMESKKTAIEFIAGSILQLARQGISIVHSNDPQSPPGRMIGSVSLREVVWYGRNQAIHYEERPKSPVVALFRTLEQEQGRHFSLSLNHGKSMAKHVITLLGWDSYEAYLSDMESLLESTNL